MTRSMLLLAQSVAETQCRVLAVVTDTTEGALRFENPVQWSSLPKSGFHKVVDNDPILGVD